MSSSRRRAEAAIRTVVRLSVQYDTAEATPMRDQVRRWVAAAVGASTEQRRRSIDAATLTFRFVGLDEGRALNRTFRGKDHATNVLTFPFDDGAPRTVEADVVVCMPVVVREAAEQGKSWRDHCAHLVVHGTLHACGYDHEQPDEAERMEALERIVLRRFRIADPYAIEH